MVSVRAGTARAGACAFALLVSGLSVAQAAGAAPSLRSDAAPAIRAASVVPRELVAVGDVSCGPHAAVSADSCQQARVAALATQLRPSALALLGDSASAGGSLADFRGGVAPIWSPFRRLWRPTPGAQAYQVRNATGYFKFFGRAAGPRGRGYYSYDLGAWHVVVLNSACGNVGCGHRSAQLRWLRRDLHTHRRECTLAYWHRPLFSSGATGTASGRVHVRPFWNALHAAGAEAVINGGDMIYERFKPQNAAGRFDRRRGIREFVAGTGGAAHGDLRRVAHNSVRRVTGEFGVLRLRLERRRWSWLFVSQAGGQVLDRGHARCH